MSTLLPQPGTAGPDPDRHGKRIGIMIVAYNAVTTIGKVLKRIPPDVWDNVEEVVVFDDASRDHTYELALGLKMLAGLDKLTVIKNREQSRLRRQPEARLPVLHREGLRHRGAAARRRPVRPEILAHLYAPLVARRGRRGLRLAHDARPTAGRSRAGCRCTSTSATRSSRSSRTARSACDLTEFHSGYRAYSLRGAAQHRLRAR